MIRFHAIIGTFSIAAYVILLTPGSWHHIILNFHWYQTKSVFHKDASFQEYTQDHLFKLTLSYQRRRFVIKVNRWWWRPSNGKRSHDLLGSDELNMVFKTIHLFRSYCPRLY